MLGVGSFQKRLPGLCDQCPDSVLGVKKSSSREVAEIRHRRTRQNEENQAAEKKGDLNQPLFPNDTKCFKGHET